MNTYRHTVEQRRQWVTEKHSGARTVRQILKEAGVSRATLYNWIDEFPDLTKESCALPEVAVKPARSADKNGAWEPAMGRHQMLVTALKAVDADKQLTRKIVQVLVRRFTLTVAQACELAGITETEYGYRPRKPEVDDELVQEAIEDLLAANPTRGFAECYELLQQQHPGWTRKQIKRVYREERLYLKRKRTRRKPVADIMSPEEPLLPQRPDASWQAGMLQADGKWTLFLLDAAEGLLLNQATGSGEPSPADVLSFLVRAGWENGTPRRLRVPGTVPFNTREVTRWCWEQKIAQVTLAMGKPENEAEVAATELLARKQIDKL